MCFLVMNPFSCDLTKMQVDQLRYLQCLNLVNNYLYVLSIYTAPGF